MDNDDLMRLHRVLLILADEVDRICKNNEIKYTLIGGSMLGAVRHKGFIPWDDDMDLAMSREEYVKFLVACKDELGEPFQLLTNINNKDYVYGFSKLLLKGTSLIEKGLEEVKYPQAIFIDIFCFDSIPDSKILRNRQKMKNYILIKILRQTQGIKDNPNWNYLSKLVFKFLKLCSLFRKKTSWVQLLNNNMVQYNDTETKYVSNMAGFWGYEKETIPSYSLEHLSYVPFEDRQYMMCDNYEEILESYYGNYMELPPVEKRHTHGITSIDFGNYQIEELK